MGIRNFKSITPGLRNSSVVDYSVLDKVKPEKSLTTELKKHSGRNNLGRITVRHRGGGAKRAYRIIDFKRDKIGVVGRVESVEYDPNRTAFIAKILYIDGERRYILAPDGLKKDHNVVSDEVADVRPGNTMLLKNIPLGTVIHNVEMKPGKGGQVSRSAGSSCQLAGKTGAYVQVKMPSGELRKVPANCYATIGSVSNQDHSNRKIGKAGRKRWLGIRPTVRGVAMNPVDHPHGGGEGRTSAGRHPVSPWALPTKGYKTRQNKRTQRMIITPRKKNK